MPYRSLPTPCAQAKAKIAQELRDIVDDIKRKQADGPVPGPVPIARPTGELAGLLAVTYPRTRLSEMVLNESARAELERIVREYRQQEKLREHGLSARRKLLLIGPPGCGKTMTASALGGEFKLPLFSVQLHGLITKFMGETAAKLYMIFDAMRQTRGIYFFDEFDAIGLTVGQRTTWAKSAGFSTRSYSSLSRMIPTASSLLRQTMWKCSTRRDFAVSMT